MLGIIKGSWRTSIMIVYKILRYLWSRKKFIKEMRAWTWLSENQFLIKRGAIYHKCCSDKFSKRTWERNSSGFKLTPQDSNLRLLHYFLRVVYWAQNNPSEWYHYHIIVPGYLEHLSDSMEAVQLKEPSNSSAPGTINLTSYLIKVKGMMDFHKKTQFDHPSFNKVYIYRSLHLKLFTLVESE